MTWVILPPDQPSLLVAGLTARFPDRRIYCVGRYYADHAREMGHISVADLPFFFQKTALVQSGATQP